MHIITGRSFSHVFLYVSYFFLFSTMENHVRCCQVSYELSPWGRIFLINGNAILYNELCHSFFSSFCVRTVILLKIYNYQTYLQTKMSNETSESGKSTQTGDVNEDQTKIIKTHEFIPPLVFSAVNCYLVIHYFLYCKDLYDIVFHVLEKAHVIFFVICVITAFVISINNLIDFNSNRLKYLKGILRFSSDLIMNLWRLLTFNFSIFHVKHIDKEVAKGLFQQLNQLEVAMNENRQNVDKYSKLLIQYKELLSHYFTLSGGNNWIIFSMNKLTNSIRWIFVSVVYGSFLLSLIHQSHDIIWNKYEDSCVRTSTQWGSAYCRIYSYLLYSYHNDLLDFLWNFWKSVYVDGLAYISNLFPKFH